MAVIGVDITDAVLRQRIVTAVCGLNGYRDTVPGPNPGDPPVPNPQTKPQFVNDWIKRLLKDQCKGYEVKVAGDAATATAATKADAEVVIP